MGKFKAELVKKAIWLVKAMANLGWARKVIKKNIENQLKKKGCNATVTINELSIEMVSKMYHIHLDADAELDTDGLEKLFENLF